MPETTNKEFAIEVLNRNQIKLTGVIECISATANQIDVKTEGGPLAICGYNLKVKNLATKEHILEAEGEVVKLEYVKAKKSFFQKLIK